MEKLSENLILIREEKNFEETLKVIIEEIKKENRVIYIGDKNPMKLFVELPKRKVFPCLAYNEYTAKLTVEHNNSSVLLIDTELVGRGLIPNIIERYQTSSYEAGRHQPRVDYITEGGVAHENYNG